MKRLFLTSFFMTTLLANSAPHAVALEGQPPLLPVVRYDCQPAAAPDQGGQRPMLIIKGKDGRILDVRGRGLATDAPDNSGNPAAPGSRRPDSGPR